MFRLISAFIADGGRYCLPESLAAFSLVDDSAVGNASPRNLTDQPCQFALQAIVEPAKRRVSSFEALIRSPTGGSPVEMFAAIAAEDRYRFDLESKAFAFSLAARLPLGKQQLAVNLLPGSLYNHPDAVGWLMDNLLAAGLRPEQVLIEVTETEVISCFDQFRKVLKALRVAGMKLAIDDFGAGYSGLSLLTRFQPDKIKVDAELVRDIHISGTKQAIVASVVRCCEDLGITVVAEGVETIEEWCWLQSVGIRLFQGFLFSRPCLNGIGGDLLAGSAPDNGPVRTRTRASSLPVGKLFAQCRQGISYRFRHHGLTVAGKAHPFGFSLAAKIPGKPYRAGGGYHLPRPPVPRSR